MKHTLIAWMRDKPGVLNQVAGLLRRRNFNIDSLQVGHSEVPGISRMSSSSGRSGLQGLCTRGAGVRA